VTKELDVTTVSSRNGCTNVLDSLQ